MFNIEFIDDIAKRLSNAIPAELSDFKKDLEHNCRSFLQGAFSKLDLVTREEFDAQKGVLAKTRNKIEILEQRLSELEKTLKLPLTVTKS